MRTLMLGLALLGLLAIFVPGHAIAAADEVFGVHEPYPRDGFAPPLSSLGAQAHRWDLNWQFVEPQAPEGGIHTYHFDSTDKVYAADLGQGVRPLIVLIGAPKWAWGQGVPQSDEMRGMPPGPGHLDDWAEFVSAAAKRYPDALGFEIWNEPDASAFWGRGVVPVDPIAYSKVLRRASEAVKATNSCAPVIGGALAAYPSTGDGHLSVHDFLAGMFAAGAVQDMDAISFHDYPSGPNPPGVPQWRAPVEWVRQELASRHLRMPLWITEAGVSTTGESAVSDAGQAQSLSDLLLWTRSQPDVGALFIHSLFDSGTNPVDGETGYGLIRVGPAPGPKTAYGALQTLAKDEPVATPSLAFHGRIPVQQDVARTGKVRVVTHCLSCCTVQARGKIRVPVHGKGLVAIRLRPAKAHLTSSKRKVLKLRLRKSQVKLFARERLGKRVRVVVQLEARTGRGIQTRHLRARLKH
jgi:hypothetical protein